jgi:hypothetical protein
MRLLATTVVRGTVQDEPHGALYELDLDAGTHRVALEFDDPISLAGRGGERGLRGIAVSHQRIYVAATRSILVLDHDLRLIGRHTCAYLGHAHEIAVRDGYLLVTSTAFDSLLAMNLATGEFEFGLCIRGYTDDLAVRQFDPSDGGGPPPGITTHLNQVAVVAGSVFLSGRNSPHLLRLEDGTLDIVATVPLGTHNVTPLDQTGSTLVFNDTESDALAWCTPHDEHRLPVPRFPIADLAGLDVANGAMARQAFARGLVVDGAWAYGGSSPATVSTYHLPSGERTAQLTLTRDVRHAIHGLAGVQ